MWLYIPSACSQSAPASEDWTSESILRWADAAATSLWWRGKPSQSRTWSQRWKRASWMHRLSGMTSPPSTHDRSEAVSIWWSEAIPASPSRTPASGSEPTTRDTSGRMSDDCLRRQMLLWPSLRTSADTSPSASDKFWRTSQPWGSMRNGACSRRPTWEPPTNARGSSSWPTAVVTDSIGARNQTANRDGSKGGQGRGNPGTTLNDAIRQLPTPDAMCGHRAGVENDPKHWERKRRKKSEQGINLHRHLNVEAAAWPTPQAADGGKASPAVRNAGGNHMLTYASLCSHLVPPTSTDGSDGSSSTPVLNPRFVETLMGFPTGWTDFEHSETQWSRYKRRLRSEFLRIVQQEVGRE